MLTLEQVLTMMKREAEQDKYSACWQSGNYDECNSCDCCPYRWQCSGADGEEWDE